VHWLVVIETIKTHATCIKILQSKSKSTEPDDRVRGPSVRLDRLGYLRGENVNVWAVKWNTAACEMWSGTAGWG
jgi:hypothetical protein